MVLAGVFCIIGQHGRAHAGLQALEGLELPGVDPGAQPEPPLGVQPDATPIGQDSELLDAEVDPAWMKNRPTGTRDEPPRLRTGTTVDSLLPVIAGRCLSEEPSAGLVLGLDVTPRAQADDLRTHGRTVAPITEVLRHLGSIGQDTSGSPAISASP